MRGCDFTSGTPMKGALDKLHSAYNLRPVDNLSAHNHARVAPMIAGRAAVLYLPPKIRITTTTSETKVTRTVARA